ncbi:MAG TPA: M23 family metallopeptidase, partial [Candidatus Binataceae bacterium]|nr:M23 family metallopeptidase [Candidatus Binataceae bacterium]
TLPRYLSQAGLEQKEASRWAALFQNASRSGLLRRDHSLTLYKDPETGELRGLKYDLDDRTQIYETSLGAGVVKTWQAPIEYVTRPVSLAFAIKEDFHRAAQKNRVPQPIVDSLEEAFSNRYDLGRLSSGAAIKLIYDEHVSRDGVHRFAGDIEAAEIQHGSRTLRAFAFRDEHGRAHLYDEDGRALGPQFLRYPLNFQYISSGFTYHRYHPILHAYRPHVGVDLAAPYGTPVKAIADGKVEYSGWCGELGNCVRIDHENQTISVYGHLSKIASIASTGSFVRIGQEIGSVGSTGLSTGPHLHFAMEKRGAYVNPLTEKLGVNHEVSPRMKAVFNNLKQRYQTSLAKLPSLGSHFIAAATRKPAISPFGDMYHVTLGRGSKSHRRSRTLSSVSLSGAGGAM